MGPDLFWAGPAACAALVPTAQAQWTQLCGSPSRLATAQSIVPALGAPTWTCSADDPGNQITFVPQGGLVATIDAVFAVGKISPAGQPANQPRVFAISRLNGHVLWSSGVGTPFDQSISSPAIDTTNSLVIVASGNIVKAFRLVDGVLAWQSPLSAQVVNASPLITSDRHGRNRVFITDFGGSAGLYCINADPFNAQVNPYQPGQILWRAPIGHASGATASYLASPDGGHIFIGTYAGSQGQGQMMCYPAGATATPNPVWVTTNTIGTGFFGGNCVRTPLGEQPAVYAASYEFFGDTLSANLLKLEATSGTVTWTIPANRTDAIPVPIGSTGLALSAGIDGFGSVRNLSLFQDLGTSATATWVTDPSLPIGGRLIQPIAISSPNGARLLCASGAAGDDDSGPGTDLYVVDPAQSPTSPTFITDHFQGAGGSAIIANGNIYTIGDSGLLAFGPAPAKLDVDQDGSSSVSDIYGWIHGAGARDVDQNGVVDAADLTRLLGEIRAFERVDMMEGRP
jgi:outer membrane protein assembly factor BamB